MYEYLKIVQPKSIVVCPVHSRGSNQWLKKEEEQWNSGSPHDPEFEDVRAGWEYSLFRICPRNDLLTVSNITANYKSEICNGHEKYLWPPLQGRFLRA
jgi:hypothetical protein